MEDPKSEMLEASAQGADTAVDETKPETFDEARAMDLIRKQREELKQVLERCLRRGVQVRSRA